MIKAAQQQREEMLFLSKRRGREDMNVLKDHTFCQLRNPWR
jgi:hypothetical protein